MTVPFEKIASVQVGQPEENKYVSAIVTLKEGGTLNLKVEGKVPCYGSGEFGNDAELKDWQNPIRGGSIPLKPNEFDDYDDEEYEGDPGDDSGAGATDDAC